MPIPKPTEDCGQCVLFNDGQGFCQPEGLGTLKVHIVGEASGEHEYNDGFPFRRYAPAGSVLERAIRRAGFSRSQFVIHNIIRCRPEGNRLEGESYEEEAIQTCRKHFQRVLDANPPSCILALGNVALKALTGLSGADRHVGDLRGYVIDSEYGLVIPSYHPSYLRRGSSKLRDDATGGKTKGTTGPGMALLGTLIHDLQRAVRVAQGIDKSFIVNPEFSDYFDNYIERPSLDDARAFRNRVRDNQNLLLTYDLEHPMEAEEPDEENLGGISAADPEGKTIFSCQFSLGPRSGIYFPWTAEYIDLAREILAMPNVKAGQFVRKNDNPRLATWGIIPAGLVIDSWEVFHHLQPDIPAKLQAIGSYMYYSSVRGRGVYDPFPFPWKFWRGDQPERYGIVDVDVLQTIVPQMLAEVKKAGLQIGYGQVEALQTSVFPNMTRRGIPVSAGAHADLKTAFEKQVEELLCRVRQMAPDAARVVHKPDGYERTPAIARAALLENVSVRRVNGPNGETYIRLLAGESKNGNGCSMGEHGLAGVNSQGALGFVKEDVPAVSEDRWRMLKPFNPDSPQQVLALVRALGHPCPTDRHGKQTTAKIEIERLARKTKHPIYQMILDSRELTTMLGTFMEDWAPAVDGRAHPSFYTAPGTGQHSAKRPNSMNAPKHTKLAGAFRRMVEAPDGHKLIDLDWKSFHVLTLGYEARDADYMRMARMDMHSFVTSHFVKEPADPTWPDDQLGDYLKYIKKKHKALRDRKVKGSVLGYQFGMGEHTLYYRQREHLQNVVEARKLLDLIDNLFPKAAAWRKQIVAVAHRQAYLLSNWGFIRYFWEVFRPDYRGSAAVGAPGDDHEAAIAFLPANDAFGLRNAVMVRLEGQGMAEKYQLVNEVHDSLFFCPPDHLADECMVVVKTEMERPAVELSDPLVAPDGLSCGVSVAVGRNWDALEEVQI